MTASINIPDPRPMPDLRPAKVYVRDAALAVDRASLAWNVTQFRDALNSLRFYLELMEKALPK
jgi:hypothetical protein